MAVVLLPQGARFLTLGQFLVLPAGGLNVVAIEAGVVSVCVLVDIEASTIGVVLNCLNHLLLRPF